MGLHENGFVFLEALYGVLVRVFCLCMEMFVFLHDEGCLAVSMERSGFCLSWHENYLCMAFGVYMEMGGSLLVFA